MWASTTNRGALPLSKVVEGFAMANVIWTILTILFIFWLIGLVAHIGGSLINILIVLVVIGVIYNLLTGRRAV
jgi:hypothetical protein